MYKPTTYVCHEFISLISIKKFPKIPKIPIPQLSTIF